MDSRQYFDSKAEDWDVTDRVERARTIAVQIGEQVQLTSATRALDFGCGTGLLGFALLPMVGHLTLADPSPGMLGVARLKIGDEIADRVTTLLLDEKGVKLPRSFDLIASLMTLHHIPDAGATVRALAAHLNSGGTLALADLEGEDGSFHGPDTDVHNGFDRAVIRSWMTESGLSNIKESSPLVMHKRVDGVDRDYPLFLLTGQKAADDGHA